MIRKRSDVSAVLIAGPTASGKSALALRFAEAFDGVVINADSMQVYRGLAILTAQPSAADRAAAPHRLYGDVDPAAEYSVGAWMRDAGTVLRDIAATGRIPIVVGGTGLYFRALLGGIDDMPAVPEEIRRSYRERLAAEGPAALHAELRVRDADAAARIRATDPQRILRALELVTVTGGPLSVIQRRRGQPLIDAACARKIVLAPERGALRERIATRFGEMMAAGASAEADGFRARPDALGPTAAKAIGLAELIDHLDGRRALDDAVERAVSRSRQYAKRQDTWFRHQLGEEWVRETLPGDVRI